MRVRSKNNARVSNRPFLVFVCLGVLIFALGGCANVAYYGQSIIGHSQLMLARMPLERAIDQAEQDHQQEQLRYLKLAQALREFAGTELGLPKNQSYQSFVPLKREYPVWNVVAAEEFSVEAKQWCYLVIGCASYRGYFKQKSAEKFAEKLRTKGYEVSVGGVSAYSTLGWFADPLLPSMFSRGEAVFAETLFHELAHQALYVNGASDFNEAFATVVGEFGAKQWLKNNRPELLPKYNAGLKAQRDFNRLLLSARKRLAESYESEASILAKRKKKKVIFKKLRKEYQLVKSSVWNGIGWYDKWMMQKMNNARIASIATYYEQVPNLKVILTACGNDMPKFISALQKAIVNHGTAEIENVDCTSV